jgi:hypothetical protein
VSEKGALPSVDLVRELDELLDSYPVEADAPWVAALLVTVGDRRHEVLALGPGEPADEYEVSRINRR